MPTTARPIHVLHVDDDPDLAEMASVHLEREDDRLSVQTATTPDDAVDHLATADVDCIVSDYEMPGTNGIEFLETVREEYPDLPFVLYTGRGSEEIASEAISAGVTEYLQKGSGTSQYTVLANRITNAVERYRSARALETSRERLSLFFEQSPLGIIEWTEEFEVSRTNEAAGRILGYDKGELVGSSWEAIVTESDRENVADVVERLLTTEGGFHSINGNVRRDGERIVCEWHNRVVTDDAGDVAVVFSQFQDITERKTREKELEWTNAVLSTLLDTLPIGVLAADGSREILAANDRLFELFDRSGSPEDIVGAGLGRVVEGIREQFADPEEFVGRVDEIVANDGSVHGADVLLEDGRTFVRTHDPIELPDGIPDGNGHLWTYRDVTEQRAYEDRLEALNETAQELITADSRERVAEIGVNAARDVLGLDGNAIHFATEDRSALVPVAGTESVYDLIGEPPEFTEGDSIAWRVYESGEALAVDDTHDDPDIYNPESPLRSELHLPLDEYGILIAGSPTPDAFDQEDLVLGQILAGGIVSALEQIEQIEQRRAREQELTKQNERLEEFARIVSHDLRNPLTVAEGRLALARDRRDWDQLAAVERSHERMSALIDDLLALASEGSHVGNIAPVDLGGVVEDCWENVSTEGAVLRVENDREIRADRSRLQQLLENLIRNSVEHGAADDLCRTDGVERTDNGGDLAVSVGDLAEGFYVEDNGLGIPADACDDVFEPGYSTGEHGTGFGLNIVKRIVDAHGWEITVRESASGGARFEITGVAFAAD
jgi:PAS domain S-box-containing protein